jgi:hypothetical protein
LSAAVLLVSITTLVVASPPAVAADLVRTDPAHDTERPGLDIVSAAVTNTDHEVTALIGFATDRRGTTVLGLATDDRAVHRVVYTNDGYGHEGITLLGRGGARPCPRMTGTWEASGPLLRISVPSTCLWRGRFGAIRAWVSTERLNTGLDVDRLARSVRIPRG